MYRTGNCAGNNGPTAFLMKGKKRRKGYTNAFLKAEGCAPGSIVVMTDNSFMMEKAWEEMMDKIVRGYRSLPVVCDNPQWWMIEIFDGFGAHLNNLPALKKRVEQKVLSLKEEGDSSSYNQAYDREVAKSDKQYGRVPSGLSTFTPNIKYLLKRSAKSLSPSCKLPTHSTLSHRATTIWMYTLSYQCCCKPCHRRINSVLLTL